MPFDLSGFQKQVKDQISFYTDPVSLEIPNDPVFVHYSSKTDKLRIMSADTLNHMNNEVKEARDKVNQLDNDPSGIRVALREFAPTTPLQKACKELLTQMVDRGMNAEIINAMTIIFDEGVRVLWLMSQTQDEPSKILLSSALQAHLEKFHVPVYLILAFFDLQNHFGAETVNAPFRQLFITAFALQNGNLTEAKGRVRDKDGDTLKTDHIVCPQTRDTIDVASSSDSSVKAKNFLALVIALAKFAKLEKEPAIHDFLAENPDYHELAEKNLRKYIKYPEGFLFTDEQQSALDKMGLQEVVNFEKARLAEGPQLNQQIKEARFQSLKEATAHQNLDTRYQNFKPNGLSLKKNALDLLIDYNKENAWSPSFRLFITGHWNRHHHQIVREAIHKLNNNEDPREVLVALENEASKHSSFNPEGSLLRRLNYLKLKFPDELLIEKSGGIEGMSPM